MFEQVVGFIFLLLIACFAWKYFDKTAKTRAEELGEEGERKVREALAKIFPYGSKILNDYFFVTKDGASQIDHIVVDARGVFVIETKNYSGLLYGKEKDRYWTQVLKHGKKKVKLYSPIKQNATHTQRIRKILPAGTRVSSLIVLVQNNRDHIKSERVINLSELREYFSKLPISLSAKDIRAIGQILDANKCTKNEERKKHVKSIQDRYNRDNT